MADNQDQQMIRAFGKRFKLFRKSQDITQAQVASQLKLENSTISRIERGKQNVTLTLIYKLAAAINVPASSLLD